MELKIELSENEQNLLEGIRIDLSNLKELVAYCTDGTNPFVTDIKSDSFIELLNIFEQKKMEFDMVIKTLVLQYNTEDLPFYHFNGKEIIFHD